MLEEIERRLTEGMETGRFEGLLFHGSGEPWQGTPRLGGDGLFWTADTPVIAQQYIPASGSSAVVGLPSPYELAQRIKPNPHSFWYIAARQMTGVECRDVELDEYGQPSSWIYPQGWPTTSECVAWLSQELGYEWLDERQLLQIKCRFEDGVEKLMPADWFLPGALLVTLSDGLSFRDLRNGTEGDLTNLEYHQYEEFSLAEKDRVDGVIINDFAQTDDEGNIGHISYGLTSHALAKLEWLYMPAVRHKYDWKQQDQVTPAIEQWSQERARLSAKGSVLGIR